MSRVLEKSIGGFLTNLIGSGSSLINSSLDAYNASSDLCHVTLGLIHFVERLEAARKISKQEEEDIVAQDYQEWLRQASHQNTKDEIIADNLCRSLIAFSHGHYFANLHIHAIKLTQSDKLLLKRTGYLYISRTMAPESDLTVLLVNTIQRDLSSSNVIQISLGLNLLPIILSLEVSSLISNSIILCLNHQQPYIKRRSAIMTNSFVRLTPESEAMFGSLVPHLLRLLTDTDPAVAIAATMTLSRAFKRIDDLGRNEGLRNEMALCCSHILLQATSGSLSQHYNVGPINAPFVQVQMLRALGNLSSRSWAVPDEVILAVDSVLTQPWGGRNLSLYMTLLEGIATVTSLPKNDSLISQSLKIVLGFLKSSLIDFKYLGVRALASVFSTLQDTITQAHLEAVLECLDSSSKILQSRTIRLMCSMANSSNYQAICVTLLEFSCKTNTTSTKDLVVDHLAGILQRLSVDIPWCVAFLSPLLGAPDVNTKFLDALKVTVCNAMEEAKTEEERTVIASSCNKLFNVLLECELTSLSKLSTVASILNSLFSAKPETIDSKTINTFLEKVKQIDIQSNNYDIFDCLLNCGLFIPECNDKVKCVLESYLENSDIHLCLISRETLLLLEDCDLTKSVLSDAKKILSGEIKPDLTLSFLDDAVVEALEKGAEPYKPFTIETRNFAKDRHRRTGSFNPFDVKSTLSVSADKESISSSTSLKSSVAAVSSASGTSPPIQSIWTSEGRMQAKTECEGDRSPPGSGCVEIAHEADETSLFEDDPVPKSAASSFLDSQKVDLTQALLKGLGLSKH